MPLSRVFQTVVGLLQALRWDKFHIPFSYWLEPFSKSRGPPGSCVKQGVLWKWFISGAQEVFAYEDWSAESGTAFMNISQPAYVCVCLCERWGHSLVLWYEPYSGNVYLLVKEKKKMRAIFMAKKLFSQSALPVFLIATVLLPTLMNSLGMCNMFEDKILLICFWSLSRNTRQEFTSLVHVLVWCFDKVTPLHLAYVYENSLAT